MAPGLTCAHEWTRAAARPGSADTVLTCKVCGATSVSHQQRRGYTVTASLDLYPPDGSTGLSTELYEFFLLQWDAQCSGLTAAGYTVNRKPATIHATAAPLVPAAGRGGGAGPVRKSGVTARDLVLASGLTFLGGVVMLVLGLMNDIGWLAISGGVVVAAFAALGFLLILFS